MRRATVVLLGFAACLAFPIVTGRFGGKLLPAGALAAATLFVLAAGIHFRRPLAAGVTLLAGLLAGVIGGVNAVFWGAAVLSPQAQTSGYWFLATFPLIGFLGGTFLGVAMVAVGWIALREIRGGWFEKLLAIPAFLALLLAFDGALHWGASIQPSTAVPSYPVSGVFYSDDGAEIVVRAYPDREAWVFAAPTRTYVEQRMTDDVSEQPNQRREFRSADGHHLELVYSKKGWQEDAIVMRDSSGHALWEKRPTLWEKIMQGREAYMIGYAAFSPDGREIAIADRRNVTIYDVRGGGTLGELIGPERAWRPGERPKGVWERLLIR